MSSDGTTARRQHAYTGPAISQSPEPTYAERVRTLALLTSIGTLSTLSRKHAGFPFGSLMVVVSGRGSCAINMPGPRAQLWS